MPLRRILGTSATFAFTESHLQRAPITYIDRDGKTWLATMSPDPPDRNAPAGVLDVQATVTITDGTTTRSLSVHIHVCGLASYCGIIC